MLIFPRFGVILAASVHYLFPDDPPALTPRVAADTQRDKCSETRTNRPVFTTVQRVALVIVVAAGIVTVTVVVIVVDVVG